MVVEITTAKYYQAVSNGGIWQKNHHRLTGNVVDPEATGHQAQSDSVNGGWVQILRNRFAGEDGHLGQTMAIDKADVVQATSKDA